MQEHDNDSGRLARIETLLQGLTASFDKQCEHDSEWKRDMHRTIHGDGNGYKGVIVRLDRLEQSEKRRSKLNWVLISALVGLLLERVVSMLH